MSQKIVRQAGKAPQSSSLGLLTFGMGVSIAGIMLAGTFLRPLIQKRRLHVQVGYIDEMLERESVKEQNITIADSNFNGDNTIGVELK